MSVTRRTAKARPAGSSGSDELVLTPEGYTKLEEEYERLTTVKRPEAATRLSQALQVAARPVPEMLLAGTFWLVLVLAFEWVGSLIVRRPVHEILEGWHVENGYMWPYVLATYFLSPLIVGLLLTRG